MIKIRPIKSKSTDENGNEIDIISPASDIPQGSKVCFINGVFEVYEQGEQIPDDVISNEPLPNL